jgi:hypothetical protein
MTAGDGDMLNPDETAGAGARVLREVIRTPAFMSIIKMNVASLDPENAAPLVRTMLWEDPELSLSLVALAPDIVNYVVEAVLELGRQLDQFPAPMLDAFLDELGRGIDTDKIGEVPVVYGRLAEKVDAGRRAAVALGAAVNAGARMINRAAGRNPYFLRDAMAEVDGREVAHAGFAVVRSACLWGYSALKKMLERVAGHNAR